jgi:hypothetical protein
MFGVGNIFYLSARHPNRLVSTNVETSFLAFVIASCAVNTYLAAFFACRIEKKPARTLALLGLWSVLNWLYLV